MIKQPACLEMRVLQRFAKGCNDRAAAIASRDALAPGLRRRAGNNLGTAARRLLGVASVVAQALIEPNDVAEFFPELLLERRHREYPRVAGRIKPKSWRAAGPTL